MRIANYQRKTRWAALLALLTLLALALAACAGAGDGKSPAAAVVERYYQAIAAHDAASLPALVCADFEADARTELDSFQGVQAELQDVTCAAAGDDGGSEITVTCQGKIVASYGAEQMDFPLSERAHRVVNEGGDWRVCGY